MNRINEIYNNAEVSEKAIERYLVARVEQMGGIALKYYNANSTGYPDRMIILPNVPLFWVELKSKGKKLRKLQEYRHSILRDLGQKVFTCDSIESVDMILRPYINFL